MTQTRWTIADVDTLPQPRDDTRYEIIEGELGVSTQPHYFHQMVSYRLLRSTQSVERPASFISSVVVDG